LFPRLFAGFATEHARNFLPDRDSPYDKLEAARLYPRARRLCFSDAIPTISFPRGGYDTKPIQDGIYQVDFAANGVTSQSQTAYYALVRAAEVTLQGGRRYFIVQNERTEMKPLPINPNVVSPIVTLEIRLVATKLQEQRTPPKSQEIRMLPV
jgi:hypothetical protein